VGGLLTEIGKRAAVRVGSGLSRVFGSCAGAGVGVLTYHRLALWAGHGPAPTWNVTPRRFREQLEGLRAHGYRPWPLRELLKLGRSGRAFPRRAFVVTFDDGYESVYRHAWPVLAELRVPASVFLATAYLDSAAPFPFDDWTEAGSELVPAGTWKPLTTSQCREMAADGLIELGSHTHTHEVFRDRPDALRQDLVKSAEVLRERFGVTEPTFAFPFGIAGPGLAEAARQAGMQCSLSTEAALVRRGSDPFTWGRFGIDDTDSAAAIAARLDGWYSLARGLWGRLRRPFGGEASR
jgi:peptidoglycan/xylan/chitin deacetylase (PgdA/CDA1 family)